MLWETFRAKHDLLQASHRGLQRSLIPDWLGQPKALHDRIESSAYGETPAVLIESILDALGIKSEELFVDLGCGGGNVCSAALARGARVLGIERNPELVAAAQAYFLPQTGAPDRLELRCADFLETDWSHAQIAYVTTARFPTSVLSALTQRVQSSAPCLRAIACLGRPLALGDRWKASQSGCWPIIWNPGEATMQEPLWLYRRLSEAS